MIPRAKNLYSCSAVRPVDVGSISLGQIALSYSTQVSLRPRGVGQSLRQPSDWNPAADQQALARVWRDGQKKECV
jgi:hypothetical protein